MVPGNFCEQAYRGRSGLKLRTSKRAFFLSNLTQIENQRNVNNPIRLFCSDYIGWIKVTTQFSLVNHGISMTSIKGRAVSNTCCEFFQESKRLRTQLRQKCHHNEIAEVRFILFLLEYSFLFFRK